MLYKTRCSVLILISPNIYLNSYNQNTGLVSKLMHTTKELMDVNAATSAAVNAAQEKVLLAGGQILKQIYLLLMQLP